MCRTPGLRLAQARPPVFNMSCDQSQHDASKTLHADRVMLIGVMSIGMYWSDADWNGTDLGDANRDVLIGVMPIRVSLVPRPLPPRSKGSVWYVNMNRRKKFIHRIINYDVITKNWLAILALSPGYKY